MQTNLLNPVNTASGAAASVQINNVRNNNTNNSNPNSQIMQNCTNILQNNANSGQIWSHPGLHSEYLYIFANKNNSIYYDDYLLSSSSI